VGQGRHQAQAGRGQKQGLQQLVDLHGGSELSRQPPQLLRAEHRAFGWLSAGEGAQHRLQGLQGSGLPGGRAAQQPLGLQQESPRILILNGFHHAALRHSGSVFLAGCSGQGPHHRPLGGTLLEHRCGHRCLARLVDGSLGRKQGSP
jgi:hypothetical protein